ncbi:flagellar biosynthesis protein FlgG [Helicobacter pylori]|nr:flagellar biosynthesis protein FlgG [Helicobacter pylori]WJJ02869.1 flagellar biosynthesis protein FlgG [Helicobacter pylori]
MSINLAGPAYRVTVPSCVLVATLRLKQKAEREVKQKAERERLEQAKRLVKQKAEREANKKNVVSSYYLSRWSSCFSCFFIKREHQPSNDPGNSPKSGVKKLKNPSRKN